MDGTQFAVLKFEGFWKTCGGARRFQLNRDRREEDILSRRNREVRKSDTFEIILFLIETPRKLKNLLDTLEANKAVDAKWCVNSIKTSAANVGATRLTQRAFMLEKLLKSNGSGCALDIFRGMQSDFREFYISSWR